VISRRIGVNSIICSIFELCVDMSHFEFAATIRRRDSSVLGVVMAFRNNILRIHKISGSSITDWNNYCRQFGTLDVLEQQLLVNDQVLCVNGQTDVIQMLLMLADVDVEKYVITVRRHRAQIESLQQTITMNGIPDNHEDIAVDLTAEVSLARDYPFRRIISDYCSESGGYLDVCKGDLVILETDVVVSGPANSFPDGYVYVMRQTRGFCKGWIPFAIVESYRGDSKS